MKKIIAIGMMIFVITAANCQMSFHSFLDSISEITDPATKIVLIDTLMNQLGADKIPYIEGDTANFIYYGSADSVWIAGDFNGWGNNIWKCLRIEDTDFFYYSRIFEQTARLDYKYILNETNWILDPRNPNQVSGGFGPNSELAMPGYVQPWEIEEYDGVANGTIESFSLPSPEVGRTYNIQVYLPPGYDESGAQNYPVAYVHDGGEYISLGSMGNVIENLLDENTIDPIIAVFVSPINRGDEYADANRFNFAQFIVETLVPTIDSNYNTLAHRKFRLTMGASFGANISGLISFTYPEVFANSGWHSPALWPNEGEVALLYLGEKKDINIYFNYGTYENLGVNWEEFRIALDGYGYQYDWQKYHEGHSWGLWRATIDDILVHFFPVGSSPPVGMESKISGEFSRGHNYPNPVESITYIPLNITQKGEYTVSVYNQLGQLEISRDYAFATVGKHIIEMNVEQLNQGIYPYLIKMESEGVSGKLVKY
jgi:enterochelin esterase-like enzyme